MAEPLTPQTEVEALQQEVATLRHKLLQSQRLSTVGALASSVTLIVGALAARAVGMLEVFPWIPKISMPHRRREPKRSRRPAVVAGPWAGTSPIPSAQGELDDLLDKISASGINSLSKAEKERLNELSKRLRGS